MIVFRLHQGIKKIVLNINKNKLDNKQESDIFKINPLKFKLLGSLLRKSK